MCSSTSAIDFCNVTINKSGQVNFGQGDTQTDVEDISPEVIAFWGTGMDAQMYRELEQRKAYWLDRLPDDLEVDIGSCLVGGDHTETFTEQDIRDYFTNADYCTWAQDEEGVDILLCFGAC